MDPSNVTSHEKLEQMLRSGTITEEDYRRLSEAMEARPEPPRAPVAAVGERVKLTKCWERGAIGGVCAGFAKYYGVDENMIRIGFVLAAVILSVLGRAGFLFGLVIVPLYFLMCAMIPWDEPDKALALKQSGNLKAFMIAVNCFYFILPLLFAQLLLPRFERIYEGLGIGVWSAGFRGTIAGRAIDCASEYRSWSNPGNGIFPVVAGLAVAVLTTLFLGLVYQSLCKERLRKYFAMTVVILGVAWLLFLVAGTYLPIAAIGR